MLSDKGNIASYIYNHVQSYIQVIIQKPFLPTNINLTFHCNHTWKSFKKEILTPSKTPHGGGWLQKLR